MIRTASPVYVKLGLKKHADIYPSGGHLEGGVVVRFFRGAVFLLFCYRKWNGL